MLAPPRPAKINETRGPVNLCAFWPCLALLGNAPPRTSMTWVVVMVGEGGEGLYTLHNHILCATSWSMRLLLYLPSLYDCRQCPPLIGK